MEVDLIIFDLDGTLVNSIPDLTNSLNHVASGFNRSMFDELLVSKLVGSGLTKLIEEAFNISNHEKGFDDYFNRFISHYEQNYSDKSYLYNNVNKILKYFIDKKIALLSNKIDYITKQVLIDFNIDTFFNLALGSTDNMAKKPSAEPVLYIMDKLKVAPSSVVMVGDSEPDIMCAKNAGIKSIAVTYGYRSKKQLEHLNPDFIIDDIMELKSIIR